MSETGKVMSPELIEFLESVQRHAYGVVRAFQRFVEIKKTAMLTAKASEQNGK